jgi:hypothetical protein
LVEEGFGVDKVGSVETSVNIDPLWTVARL